MDDDKLRRKRLKKALHNFKVCTLHVYTSPHTDYISVVECVAQHLKLYSLSNYTKKARRMGC